MSAREDLAELVGRLAGARVVVVGDAMLDRYVYGAVERVSPEAPIPVLRVEREQATLGGAGNVLRNLAALGVKTRLASVVGDDAAGAEIAAQVEEATGHTPGLVVEPGRMTTIKTRFVAGVQQLLRADREKPVPISAASATALLNRLDPVDGVLILSDYGKGVLSGRVIEAALARAREARQPVVVDPKGTDFAKYRGATIVTPNRKELAAASGMPVGNDGEVARAARAVIEKCGIANALVTRSEQGMTLVPGPSPGTEGPVHLAAEAREVFDVSGAGDTVVAVLAAALAAGAGLADAARLANTAAGIVVGKIGTAVVHQDELLHELRARELMTGERKVLARGAALDRIESWRRKGQRIGFTNGCFDLLHPGHVALLSHARGTCDRLVVGLNSDASTARLKGKGRPVQPEAARALVLASLQTVDLVVPFAEDTPLELIRAIKPDVLVKGADYIVDTVVGADVVQSYGGKVVLAPLLEGHSTTQTIRRLKR